MSALWLAVGSAVALSPSLWGTWQHVAREPWKAATLCGLAIAIAAVRHAPGEGRLRALALPWLVAAVLVQLAASTVDWEAGFRIAVALGGIGVLRVSDRAPLGAAAWWLAVVPPPSVPAKLASPALEQALGAGAALALGGGPYPLPLGYGDSGLMPVWLGGLFGAAWAWRRGLRWLGWAAPAACGAAAGLVAQVVALVVVGALQGPLVDGVARTLLDLVPGFAIGAVGTYALWRPPALPGDPT